jgi:hypothetical protein
MGWSMIAYCHTFVFFNIDLYKKKFRLSISHENNEMMTINSSQTIDGDPLFLPSTVIIYRLHMIMCRQ